jgi:diguanylate cyclase (GGDEF)-like protein
MMEMIEETTTFLTVLVEYEHDVVIARGRAREAAEALGFPPQERMQIATAVSEVVRNAFMYAGGGKVEFQHVRADSRRRMVIVVSDSGPGIEDLDSILAGHYTSRRGLGQGIMASRRLMDGCDIDTAKGRGTRVTLTKHVPQTATPIASKAVMSFGENLTRRGSGTLLDEIRVQNRELLASIDEIRARKLELEKLNEELVEKQKTIQELLRTDPLTGIGNRRWLEERLPVELERARRRGHALALVMTDIDHFKRVNDTFGHQVGDIVLAAVGATLGSGARRYDIVARYGGEEFVLALPETDAVGALAACERLRAAIAALRFETSPVTVTASFGIALWIPDESLQDLIVRSDRALYEAKSAGRNRAVVA